MGSPVTGLTFRTLATDQLMHVYHEAEVDDPNRVYVQPVGNHPPHLKALVRVESGVAMCDSCAVALEAWPCHAFVDEGARVPVNRPDGVLIAALANSDPTPPSAASIAEAALAILRSGGDWT